MTVFIRSSVFGHSASQAYTAGGVYFVKKYKLNEKIHSRLENPRREYASWKRIDQALGGTIEARYC